MDKKRYIRPIVPTEWGDAMRLVWKVFLRFVSDEYSHEGVCSFYNFITDDVLYMMFKQGVYRIFGCFEEEKLTGVISLRSGNHISLLFVDEAFQRQGIAAALMRYVKRDVLKAEGKESVTVDSAPGAVGFYRRLGFKETKSLQSVQGITYIPMEAPL